MGLQQGLTRRRGARAADRMHGWRRATGGGLGVGWGLLAAADVPRAESPPPAAVARRRRRRETRRAGLLGPGGPAARTTRRQGGLVGGLGVVAANEFESRPNTYLNGPNSQLKAAPDESHAPLAAPKKRRSSAAGCKRGSAQSTRRVSNSPFLHGLIITFSLQALRELGPALRSSRRELSDGTLCAFQLPRGPRLHVLD
jgi:hypothetical protein